MSLRTACHLSKSLEAFLGTLAALRFLPGNCTPASCLRLASATGWPAEEACVSNNCEGGTDATSAGTRST